MVIPENEPEQNGDGKENARLSGAQASSSGSLSSLRAMALQPRCNGAHQASLGPIMDRYMFCMVRVIDKLFRRTLTNKVEV